MRLCLPARLWLDDTNDDVDRRRRRNVRGKPVAGLAFVCFPGFCGRRARVRREECRTDFVLTRVDGAPPLLDLPSYSTTTTPLYSTRHKTTKRLRCQMGSDRTRWAVGRHSRTGARTHGTPMTRPLEGGSGGLGMGRDAPMPTRWDWDRGSHSLCLGWWARFRNQQACLVTCQTRWLVQCSCSYRAGMGAEAHTRAREWGLLAR